MLHKYIHVIAKGPYIKDVRKMAIIRTLSPIRTDFYALFKCNFECSFMKRVYQKETHSREGFHLKLNHTFIPKSHQLVSEPFLVS